MGLYLINTTSGLCKLIGRRISEYDIQKLEAISNRIDRFIITIEEILELGIPLQMAYKIETRIMKEAAGSKVSYSELLTWFKKLFGEIQLTKERFSEWGTVMSLIELAKESAISTR